MARLRYTSLTDPGALVSTLTEERTVATVKRRILDDTFAIPTGIAKANDRLLVSNGQLFTLPMLAPFTVSSISLK